MLYNVYFYWFDLIARLVLQGRWGWHAEESGETHDLTKSTQDLLFWPIQSGRPSSWTTPIFSFQCCKNETLYKSCHVGEWVEVGYVVPLELQSQRSKVIQIHRWTSTCSWPRTVWKASIRSCGRFAGTTGGSLGHEAQFVNLFLQSFSNLHGIKKKAKSIFIRPYDEKDPAVKGERGRRKRSLKIFPLLNIFENKQFYALIHLTPSPWKKKTTMLPSGSYLPPSYLSVNSIIWERKMERVEVHEIR